MLDLDFKTIYKEALSRKRKIVGWGTGSVFRLYYPILPVTPDYIVDNDASRWGKKIEGIPIKSPDTLLQEQDPEQELLIIVYSSFIDQISEQIKTMGPFVYASAAEFMGYKAKEDCLKQLQTDIRSKENVCRKPNGRRAIVIQGPILSSINVDIIKHYAVNNPEDLLIVSTWAASSPKYISQIKEIADEVILNTPPDFSGHQNRNYQIVSTIAGLRKAKKLGVEYALKMRSDIALFSNPVMDNAEHLLKLYDSKVCNQYGLKNRFIIPDIYTRKYVLYNASDHYMFGYLDDLLMFWDIPLDTRRNVMLEEEWHRKTLKQMSIEKGSAECYLNLCFMEKIGRQAGNSFEDSLNFYRDFFIIMDTTWWNSFWVKCPKFSKADIQHPLHLCVDHFYWQQLYLNGVKQQEYEKGQVVDSRTWNEFYDPKLQLA